MANPRSSTILPVVACEQQNNYECGPAAVRTILNSIGNKISRAEMVRLFPADPQNGVSPQMIKNFLSEQGIKYSESHLNTLADLERHIDEMRLCLVCYQAWGNLHEVLKLESGHYSVVYGYNKTHFFLADPSIHPTEKRPKLNGKRTIRKDIFLKRWVDIDDSNNKYDQWLLAVPLSNQIPL